MMPRCRALWVSLALLAPLARHARAASISALEAARIERLLQFVESQKQCKFVRSGSAYTAREAAQFLRAKYAKMGEHVTTAAQFIDQIAARSSTSVRGSASFASSMTFWPFAPVECAEAAINFIVIMGQSVRFGGRLVGGGSGFLGVG